MKIYHTETQEDYDALMVELEGEGVLWCDGDRPIVYNCWRYRKGETVIYLYDDKTMAHGYLIFAERNYPDIPIQKYKVK